jgi:hypothetical protein
MNPIDRFKQEENHDHFWIEDELLFQSYRTIRGLRYCYLFAVPGMPDEENCSDACLEYIKKQYEEAWT